MSATVADLAQAGKSGRNRNPRPAPGVGGTTLPTISTSSRHWVVGVGESIEQAIATIVSAMTSIITSALAMTVAEARATGPAPARPGAGRQFRRAAQ
jgi:hypothetical protein